MRWVSVILWLLACSVSATELGRVFFTPQERVQLEQHITGQTHLRGVVRRVDGTRTVWLGSRRYRDAAVPAGAEPEVRARLKQVKP